MPETPPAGRIAWHDLTVKDAKAVRDFYADVLGWTFQEMEGDFNMFAPGSEEPVAGICHAKGVNAKLPPVWLAYVMVDRIDDRVQEAVRKGGKVLDGPRAAGPGAKIAVISDPAGAVLALFDAGPST